jgi:hypothetical protein
MVLWRSRSIKTEGGMFCSGIAADRIANGRGATPSAPAIASASVSTGVAEDSLATAVPTGEANDGSLLQRLLSSVDLSEVEGALSTINSSTAQQLLTSLGFSRTETTIGGTGGTIVVDTSIPTAVVGDCKKTFAKAADFEVSVVRPDDLFVARFEFVNMKLAGQNLVPNDETKPSWIVMVLPPQHIGEEAFFETTEVEVRPYRDPNIAEGEGTTEQEDPDAGRTSDDTPHPPVRARLAGESRLSFSVPAGSAIPYTLAGLLEALLLVSPGPSGRWDQRCEPFASDDYTELSGAM